MIVRTAFALAASSFLALTLVSAPARAVASAELYTSTSYGYGRFEARVRFAAGDGVVSSFFLWKDGSEQQGTFWNELDYEKVGADCHLATNAYYGNPAATHSQTPGTKGDLCGVFHTYAYEWTPDAIVWLLDGAEVRRETGDTAAAYANNATAGMQVHLNLWPGDASFGGNFNASSLPVFEYVDWVQFSSYANGAFTLAWREDFDAATVPSGWLTGNWASPKNLSTHDARNVGFINGYAVLSLTADDATGSTGADPGPPSGGAGAGAGGQSAGGSAGAGAAAGAATGGSNSGSAGESAAGTTGVSGSPGSGGAAATGGAAMSAGGAGGSGVVASGGSSGAVPVGGMPGAGGTAVASGNAGSSDAHPASGQGPTGDGASGSAATVPASSSGEGGGGCNVAGARGRPAWMSLIAVAAAAVLLRRRRR
jgi:hypothetical protein